MRQFRLENMIKGWFVGNIVPAALRTSAVEVAVKKYETGAHDRAHFHKIATEVTVLISGTAELNGKRYGPGDIMVIEPGEVTDFRTLEATVTVVVKIPGANDDKYEV